MKIPLRLFQMSRRPVIALYTAHGSSLMGNVLSDIAVPWFVYELTGSATLTAVVLLTGQLPNLLVGLFGGYVIDRWGAVRTSLTCDLINVFAVAMIPLLYQLEVLDVAALSVLVFLSKALDSPGQSAKQVLLAQVIEEQQLPRERNNGVYSLIETGADIVGPVAAGVLIASMGAALVLMLDAFTFAIATIVIALGFGGKKSTPHSVSTEPWRATWQWMFGHPLALRLVAYDALINLVATALLALTLPVLANELLNSPIWLGTWLATFAAGATLTTVVFAWIGQHLNHLQILRWTPVGQAVALLLIALVLAVDASAGWIAAALFFFGLNLGVGSVLDAQVLQIIVPKDKRGTVFSLFTSLRYVFVPIGLLSAGFLLEREAVTLLFVLFAGIVCLAALLWAKKSALPLPPPA